MTATLAREDMPTVSLEDAIRPDVAALASELADTRTMAAAHRAEAETHADTVKLARFYAAEQSYRASLLRADVPAYRDGLTTAVAERKAAKGASKTRRAILGADVAESRAALARQRARISDANLTGAVARNAGSNARAAQLTALAAALRSEADAMVSADRLTEMISAL